jgi:hypothetical protein
LPRTSSNTAKNETFQVNATPADKAFSARVRGSVNLIDSYFSSGYDDSYVLYALVNKDENFVPVGLSMTGASTSSNLEPINDLRCFRLEVGPTNIADPYYQYKQGKSTAYKSLLKSDHSKRESARFTLFVRDVSGRILSVDDLKLNGGCTQIVVDLETVYKHL